MPEALISYPTEPIVGSNCDVRVTVASDDKLTAGSEIEWQLPHSWTALGDGPTYTKRFDTTDPLASNYVDATAPSATFETSVEPRHLPDKECTTRHGRRFISTVSSGRVAPGDDVTLRVRNTSAPAIAETEPLYVRVDGEEVADPPVLTTCPGEFDRLRLVVPSTVRPNEEFSLAVVPLDGHDNPTQTSLEDDLTLANGTVVRNGLSVTDTRRVSVAIKEPGIHRFQYAGVTSNPVSVEADQISVLWGDTHAHTGLSHDGQGSHPYSYARDVSQLDFAAVTDHVESLGDDGHKRVLEWAHAAHNPRGEGFVAIPAYERQLPSAFGDCHCNFYFSTLDAYQRQRDRDDLALIADDREPEGSVEPDLVMPHHTGVSGYACNLDDLDTIIPAVEVYSHHGQAEYYAPQHVLSYEFNRLRKRERRVNHSEHGPHYFQDFLVDGNRIGTIASSDDHTGRPGRPESGIVAVRGADRSRESILEAIRERRCYGTTGERILLEFTVEGEPMGSEIRAEPGTSLEIDLEVQGTDRLLNVEVVRSRLDSQEGFVSVFREAPDAAPRALDDQLQSTPNAGSTPRSETPSASYRFTDVHEEPAIYYCRITQAPVERPGMAWSSPVWVDVH